MKPKQIMWLTPNKMRKMGAEAYRNGQSIDSCPFAQESLWGWQFRLACWKEGYNNAKHTTSN